MLVEGTTGKDRLCNDYDEARQRCRVWAHVVSHRKPKKLAVIVTTQAAQSAGTNALVPSEITEGKSK
jgi:hypothetical protein